MKKLTLLSLIALMLFSCKENKSEDKFNLVTEISKRNIQYLKGYEYLYKFGKIDLTSKFLTQLQEFDKNGYLIKEITYKRPDSVKYPTDSIMNIFDSKGNLIERLMVRNDLDYMATDFKYVVKVSKYIYKYDGSNNRIQLDMYNDGKLDSKTMYKYDENNNVLSYTSYNAKGEIENHAEYKYDGKHETGYTYFNADNKIKERTESKWNGNVITNNHYNENDSLESTSVRKLDAKERVVEHEYKHGDYYSKSAFTYNDWGLVITTVQYKIPAEPFTKLEFEIVEFKK